MSSKVQEAYSYRPEKLDEVLATFPPASSKSQDDHEAQKAIFLAEHVQESSLAKTTPQEKKRYEEMAKVAESPEDKTTLIHITDQVFRSLNNEREAGQLLHILDHEGIPRFLGSIETALFKLFTIIGPYVPGLAMPIVREGIQWETGGLILPAEKKPLLAYLKKRREEGLRVNLNFLGEAILGEQEAEKRFNEYVEALSWPEVEVVSIKISTIFSQLSSLSWNHTVSILTDRLEALYNVADKEKCTGTNGHHSLSKFIYLDMEEYSDMRLTAEAFMKTLDRDGLENVRAGIALQAYIPDSLEIQREITHWAKKRVRSGKSPVTIRLVKGANMEMEKVIASTKGWPQAPFKSKAETDANFKRMLREGVKRENIDAVRLGVASHNVFDLSYAILLGKKNNTLDKIQFEMLEGMANPLRRALGEFVPNLLLYAPACKKESFVPAIGYLIRRLDENTGEQNFLRYAFNLKPDGDAWEKLKQGFLESLKKIPALSLSPRRRQDRTSPSRNPQINSFSQFSNEPDTDFSLPQNSKWARDVLERWKGTFGEKALEIPLVVNGNTLWKKRGIKNSFDPSRPGTVVCRYQSADKKSLAEAISSAHKNHDEWKNTHFSDRYTILKRVAGIVRQNRGELIGSAVADAGKTFQEADAEVSEAIDFLEYYTLSAKFFFSLKNITAMGKGVTAVVSPWNFPIAIPCGGISAALSAGNSVILKPSSQSVLPAWILCTCFWEAGVSKKTLQFLPCNGALAHENLVGSRSIHTVILTGATETAHAILKKWPRASLSAETGGKNATIVTALSDRDQAVKNVIHSAFSHSGQKCSATSLLVLEEEVYEDPDFRNTLIDAVQSLEVGSSWNLETKVGPLISTPSDKLERGLHELETGERWVVRPENREQNPHLYSPGVKWGVKPGNFSHMVELFGPVLNVIKAKDLKSAVQIVNQTEYGLTSAIESLDVREQKSWIHSIRAGNLYINKPTTGAIVMRQPFGGIGKSSVGPGFKAGGPNYVFQLVDFQENLPSKKNGHVSLKQDDLTKTLHAIFRRGTNEIKQVERDIFRAIQNYRAAYQSEFLKTHDDMKILGEDNFRKYVPVKKLCIRVTPEDTLLEIFSRISAAVISGCRAVVSISPKTAEATKEKVLRLCDCTKLEMKGIVESEDTLKEKIEQKKYTRIRYASKKRVPGTVREVSIRTNVFLADAKVTGEGRLELLWFFKEQSESSVYHRYGNLGNRKPTL